MEFLPFSRAKTTNAAVLTLILSQFIVSAIVSKILEFVYLDSATQILLVEPFVFLPGILLFFRLQKKRKETVRFQKALRLRFPGWKNLLYGVAFGLLIQPIMYFFSAASLLLFDNRVGTTISSMEGIPLPVALFAVAAVPAFFEESAFRGMVFYGYGNLPRWKQYLGAGLMFAIMHMDGQQFLYALFAGVLFCFMTECSDSLLPAIVAHFTVNATQTCMALETGVTSSEAIDIAALLIQCAVLLVPSVPLLIFTLWKFYQENIPRTESGIVEKKDQDRKEILADGFFLCVLAIYGIVIFGELFT